jgi:hypothetical protein
VEFVDNTAVYDGGGLYVGETGEAELRGCSILRNSAESGGGVSIYGEASLVSTDSDWGADTDDNTPSDVLLAESGAELAGYGVASFGCDGSSCTPEP